MAEYDVTTIGNLLGSCECGKPNRLDVARIAGVAETAAGVFDRLNPFSDNFWPRELGRRAAEAAEQKAADVLKGADPLPFLLDTTGVPTWGYHRDLIVGGAAIGALAIGGLLVMRAVKKRKAARRAPGRKQVGR